MLEQMIAGNGFPKVVVENDHCRVFQMMGGTGDGSMTQYDLYPGITLMYNDFHMEDYDSDLTITGDLLCIDYCRQGRMEYPAGPDAYSYVEAGDLKLDRRLEHRGTLSFHFPTITGSRWGWSRPGSPGPGRMGAGLSGDLYRLRDKYCSGPTPRYSTGPLRWIISSRSSMPYRTDQLSFPHQDAGTAPHLDALNCPRSRRSPISQDAGGENESDSPPADRDLERHYTITELSRRFSIPTTALKECFKSVYGQPINTLYAVLAHGLAALLPGRSSHAGVAEIAGRVGYDSASKFAAAFKAVKGKTPLEYRREGQ
ncbi:MAG: helix-turn-helix domain-containing protein [Eubacteriales bacterium]